MTVFRMNRQHDDGLIGVRVNLWIFNNLNWQKRIEKSSFTTLFFNVETETTVKQDR